MLGGTGANIVTSFRARYTVIEDFILQFYRSPESLIREQFNYQNSVDFLSETNGKRSFFDCGVDYCFGGAIQWREGTLSKSSIIKET